ncbi:MAG: hypothetical protein IKJ13_02590 [Clostridia bacterium]|nr:hypothetical protein [Clostridia bacterium]
MFTNEEIEKQSVIDKAVTVSYWQRLETALTDKSDKATAKKIVDALRNYCDEVFAGDLTLWIANLYDYESGGFYYSNSGRDNDGFLPDIESTKQAMTWIFSNSIKPESSNSYADFYPKWIQKRVVKFIKERQDVNGYFYHPQWPRELTDSKPHRRGRDLNWATEILSWFGEQPTYDTPNGVRGNGILADGTAVSGFSHREDVGVVAPKEELVAPHLKDKESFVAYLNGFDLKELSYPVSNTLEAQAKQIVIRDKVLKDMGADYSLCDILVDWYAKHQDPTTGLFTFKAPNATGLNGLMKSSSVVHEIQRAFPNPLRGIESSIKVIESDEPMGSVCCVMNPLCTINTLIANIKMYGSGAEETAKYKQYILEHAAEIIQATKNKILAFKKPDGSFSFSPDHSSVTSQGHPVAVLNTNEGDVNATTIATSPTLGHLLAIIEAPKPPIFTGADVMRLFNIIDEKKERYSD